MCRLAITGALALSIGVLYHELSMAGLKGAQTRLDSTYTTSQQRGGGGAAEGGLFAGLAQGIQGAVDGVSGRGPAGGFNDHPAVQGAGTGAGEVLRGAQSGVNDFISSFKDASKTAGDGLTGSVRRMGSPEAPPVEARRAAPADPSALSFAPPKKEDPKPAAPKPAAAPKKEEPKAGAKKDEGKKYIDRGGGTFLQVRT